MAGRGIKYCRRGKSEEMEKRQMMEKHCQLLQMGPNLTDGCGAND
jgi:hypothetical protein